MRQGGGRGGRKERKGSNFAIWQPWFKECERLHKLGVEMFKSPNGGGIRGIAFIRDPDGYAIEILTHQPIGPQLREVDCLGNKAKEGQGVTGGATV